MFLYNIFSSEASLYVIFQRETFSQNTKLRYFRNVSKIIKHEKYYSGGFYNDIALLILESPINITPVCLPNPNQNFDGNNCIAVGWNIQNRKF